MEEHHTHCKENHHHANKLFTRGTSQLNTHCIYALTIPPMMQQGQCILPESYDYEYFQCVKQTKTQTLLHE